MKRKLTEKDLVEVLICDVLIDQEFNVSVCEITPEINYISMMDFRYQLGLVLTLVFSPEVDSSLLCLSHQVPFPKELQF